jgi:glycine cleavage system H protein
MHQALNEDPSGTGWFLKLKIKDKAELETLMSEAQYQDYLKTLG